MGWMELAPQLCKSTIQQWLWFGFELLRLVGWRVHSEAGEQLPSWTGTYLLVIEKLVLSVEQRLMRWPRLALGQARHGREAGSTSLAWEEMAGVLQRERRHGGCHVGNWGAQRCKEMVRWNVGELCMKWCLEGWSMEAVGCTWWPKKFCVSFFPFCSLWTCSRVESLLPINSFIFLLRNTSLNLEETMLMWHQSSCEMWSSRCCGPKGRCQYINLPFHMVHGCLWGQASAWRGNKPSKGILTLVILLFRVRSHFLDFMFHKLYF